MLTSLAIEMAASASKELSDFCLIFCFQQAFRALWDIIGFSVYDQPLLEPPCTPSHALMFQLIPGTV